MTSAQSPQEDKKQQDEQPSLSRRLKSLAERQNLDQFAEYSKHHKREIIAYVLLTIGILSLFIWPIFGQALIGLIMAIFFTAELRELLLHYDFYVQRLGIARSIIIGGMLLAFFIQAPFIFLAAAATLLFKYLLVNGD